MPGAEDIQHKDIPMGSSMAHDLSKQDHERPPHNGTNVSLSPLEETTTDQRPHAMQSPIEALMAFLHFELIGEILSQ